MTPEKKAVALEEAKVLLKHLAASIEHETRCGTPLLVSTKALADAALAFVSGVPTAAEAAGIEEET